MDHALRLSTELSSLIDKGLLWRGEGSSAAKHSTTAKYSATAKHCATAKHSATEKHSVALQINQSATPTPRLLPSSRPPATQQLFLQHGLPLGAVHEWCVAQGSHKTSSALKKPSVSASVPPFSIITAILRSTLSQQISAAPGAGSSSTKPSSSVLSSSVLSSSDPRLILWIGKNSWPTPHLLAQASRCGINLLSRSLFIDPPDTKTKLWAIDAALRSPGVFGVVAQCSRLSTTMSRRFSLAAAQGGAVGFIVRPEKELALPSAAMSRWRVRSIPNAASTLSTESVPFPFHPRWEVELLKCKGSFIPPATLPVRWFVEVCDEISLSFPAELVSGSNKTEATYHSEHKPKRQSA